MSARSATIAQPAVSQETDDPALAARWQAGDRAAGSALIDRHLPRLRAFLAVRCGDRTEADDLAQETFLAVCRNLHTYDRQHPFTGWLYAIARRKLADFWRRRAPIGPLAPLAEPVDDNSPARLHEAAEAAADAWRIVFARLPEAQASALWLRVQEDLGVEEIARTLDISLANAKVLLFRARQTLAPLFQPRLLASS